MVKNIKKKDSVWIAPTADVIGNVTIGEESSVWYRAVVRGDVCAITIGEGSNIQDGAVIHGNFGHPVTIGNCVTIGHNAIVHGCTIGNNVLVGMGAIILDDAEIGENCIIGAGALVTSGKKIPSGSLVLGSPAKVVREVTKEEITKNADNAMEYMCLKNLQ